jgi:CRP-like cAMP-binding protein
MARRGYYESVSNEERLRRVGLLLSKGVALLCAREAQMRELAASSVPDVIPGAPLQPGPPAKSLNADDERLLALLCRVGEIAPREVTEFLGVSRVTAFRRLTRLEKEGWILKTGNTTASRYYLTRQATIRLKAPS